MSEEKKNKDQQTSEETSPVSESEFENLEDSFKKFRKRLKYRHQVLYILIGFIGAVMAWKGLWSLLDQIPLLENKLICFIGGILILIVTGAFFREM